MSYRIASFNIQKFGRTAVSRAEDGSTKKDVDAIATIIRNNAFDIVAIQEITNKEALKELLERISYQYAEVCKTDVLLRGNKNTNFAAIGNSVNDVFGYRTKHWEGRWAKPNSEYGGLIAEGYAFIWNRDRIKLVTNMNGENFEPRIADFGDYKKLVRPPFIGRFMPINGSYEFRLINTHIVYAIPSKQLDESNDDDNENSSRVDIKDYELRQKEFESLINTIYYKFSVQQYDNTGHDKFARMLVPYTFLLGDYNLNLNGSGGKSPGKIGSDRECMNGITTVNHDLTTLKGKPKDAEKQQLLRTDTEIKHHLANNYDHFTYNEGTFISHQISNPQVGVILAFEMYKDKETENDTKFDLYRSKVSDHLPICMEIDIRSRRNEEG